MRTVQIYVENVRLDLFQDEKIEVTSSIQNIKDISKVYTDFSQSFTVPASKVNNGVFDHYYNNDVNGTFIAKNRADARIEINHTPFRVGKIQLEGAEIKNNKAESYKITFFGDVITLKDKFGDDKLKDLDYSTIQTEYNGTEILASLTSVTDDDVRYPLISSNRIWDYAGGGIEDISDSANPIVYNELFPAIRVAKIFELIQSKYDLVFSGTFLNDSKFTNLFTWWKNRKETDFDLAPVRITFDWVGNSVFTSNEVYMLQQDMDTLIPVGYTWYPSGVSDRLNIYHSCDNIGATYSIDIYRRSEGYGDKILYNTFDFTVVTAGLQDTGLDYVYQSNGNYENYIYSFELRCDEAITVYNVAMKRVTKVWVKEDALAPSAPIIEYATEVFMTRNFADNPFVLSPYLDLGFPAPDIKVADYFSGILSEFNLTCFPLQDSTTFQIEPVDVWYGYGGEIDITPYTIIDSINIERPKLYKSISFEWAKSKSFLNEAFTGAYGRDYGNLMSIFPYDGGDFKIKLPFENLYFNRFPDTDLQVAYATTEAVIDKGYIPKVCNLYLDESKDCSFYFNDGTTTTEVISYVPLGQDTVHNGNNYTSNFGLDVSTLKNISVPNTLYKTYYEPYLLNLYDDKTRMVKIDCMLPLSTLIALTLDDAIILRDKKYRINSMKTDLTSGLVSLELLSDWTNYFNEATVVNITSVSQVVSLPTKPIKPAEGSYLTITDTSVETSFMTCSETLPYTSYTEGTVTFTATANTTGAVRTNQFTITHYNANGGVFTVEVINYVQDIERNYLRQENKGKVLTEVFDGILL